MKKIASFLVAALALSGCVPEENTGAKREARATSQLQDQASSAVGMPAVIHFTEKRMMKMLYELRDNANLVTYTYYVDMNGNRHKVCPSTSIGFGIPYSAQFTAPTRDVDWHQNTGTIHQPEPNGLYMPESSSATWVMCMGPDKKPVPTYVEPLIIVSTSPLD